VVVGAHEGRIARKHDVKEDTDAPDVRLRLEILVQNLRRIVIRLKQKVFKLRSLQSSLSYLHLACK